MRVKSAIYDGGYIGDLKDLKSIFDMGLLLHDPFNNKIILRVNLTQPNTNLN